MIASMNLFAVVYTVICLQKHTESLKITRLSVPPLIQNGTEDSVILDCEYNYTIEDVKLVIKWYLNDDPEPLYQWIPELNLRHVTERFQNRLNLEYVVPNADRFTKYRAMNIIRPTVELSGKYSCHVSSLSEQDLKEKLMIVFAPAKKFEFNFTKPTSDTVNLTCEAEGVFPLPLLNIYEITPKEAESKQINDVTIKTHKTENVYNVFLTKLFSDGDLPGDGTITYECVLTIPGTKYSKQAMFSYYTGDVNGSLSVTVNSLKLLLLAYMITTYL